MTRIRVTDTTPRPSHTTTTTSSRASGPGWVDGRYAITHTWACTCGATGEGRSGLAPYAHANGTRDGRLPRAGVPHAEVLSVVR